MKKFLLVDDHVVVRSGMQGILSKFFDPCQIDHAENGETATEHLKKNAYDLIMMDIKMPETDTLGLMDYIRTRYPEAKVLILSMNAENVYGKRFLKAGAKGFISKEAPMEELTKAIGLVLNGRKYISESLAQSMAEQYVSNNSLNPFDRLSGREFEIVYLLLAGQTISDIAKSLSVHVSTVGTHKTRIFDKLDVSNILELKALADMFKI
jgi:two-component system invasion response regulator UvrY